MNIIQQLNNLVLFPISLTLSSSYKIDGHIIDVKNDFIHFENQERESMFIPIRSVIEIERNTKLLPLQPDTVKHVDQARFREVVSAMKQNWLYVRRNNLDWLEGVLIGIFMDHALLVQEEKVIIIPLREIEAVREHNQFNEDVTMNSEQDDNQENESESGGEETETNSSSSQQGSAINEKIDKFNARVQKLDWPEKQRKPASYHHERESNRADFIVYRMHGGKTV